VSAMSCAQTADLLDAFVDAELPGPMLLAVARHAGSCAECDGALRERTALHEAIERTVREEAEGLDLSGVWPAVEARAAHADARRLRIRQLRRVPAWAAMAALAAGAVLWVRTPAPEPVRVATTHARPNRAVIERLSSEGARVALRSERKNGTTLIMVNADADEAVR
jgi:anti-sigma factor RsiW